MSITSNDSRDCNVLLNIGLLVLKVNPYCTCYFGECPDGVPRLPKSVVHSDVAMKSLLIGSTFKKLKKLKH